MRAAFFLLLLFCCFHGNTQSLSIEKKLDAFFNTEFKKNQPGAAVLIVKDGKVIYQKGFGIEDINTKKPITPQTLFNTGSISKTFVALSILKLASEGKLSLDDGIYKYFPDFRNTAIAKRVKIYHLLTHSSGLPDNRKTVEDSVFYLTAKDAENFEPIKQTDTLNFEPGEKFEYSNPAFNGLALIIEKVSGMKWQEFVKKTIMRPSGMLKSDITDGPHPESGVSHGYLWDGKRFSEKDYGEEPTFPAAGNGGVWSSVDELWKYEQAIQRHIFLSKEWIEKSGTIYDLKNWKETAYSPFIGLCWFISNEENNKMVGHTGSQGGFRGDYQWLSDQKIFYVFLCNTPRTVEDIRRNVFDILKKSGIMN